MKAKKVILTIAAMMLVAVVAVSTTFAYLTSKPTAATNTFTIGKIAIKLDEADVDEYGVVKDDTTERKTENEYKLIPDHTYTKDPIVWVLPDSEASILFVKVENGIADIEEVTSEGEGGYKNIDAQIKAYGWTQLTIQGDVTYQVYYKLADAVDKEETINAEYKVFDQFKIKKDAVIYEAPVEDDLETTDVDESKEEMTYAGKTIVITAYAIQQDGFVTAGETTISANQALKAWNALQ